HQAKGVRNAREGKFLIDNRFQVPRGDVFRHVVELFAAADGDAVNMEILAENDRKHDRAGKSAQYADHDDAAANPDRLERLTQCVFSTNFNDDVDAAPACQLTGR